MTSLTDITEPQRANGKGKEDVANTNTRFIDLQSCIVERVDATFGVGPVSDETGDSEDDMDDLNFAFDDADMVYDQPTNIAETPARQKGEKGNRGRKDTNVKEQPADGNWRLIAKRMGLNCTEIVARTSIYPELSVKSSLTEEVEACVAYAEQGYDHDKAKQIREENDLASFLSKDTIIQQLEENAELLKATGNVLNVEEIRNRVDSADPEKELLTLIAQGYDVTVHESVKHVEPPTEDCSDLEYAHIIAFLEDHRAVITTLAEFEEQVQSEKDDCHPCFMAVVPKTGKGKATLGRFVTDLSALTGNSVNGPRISGKLLTSQLIADITGEILNPIFAEQCKMVMDALALYGNETLMEIKDISKAYWNILLSIDAMQRCGVYVRHKGEIYVLIMSVASMGLYASGFLWETVKNVIVYEAERRAKIAAIPHQSVVMYVDDRFRVASKDFFEQDEKADVAFLGGENMGIIGKHAVENKKTELKRALNCTGHYYDLDAAAVSLSYGRIARIVTTWVHQIGWSRAGERLWYARFMKIVQYSYTIQAAVPFLSHYHRKLVLHLKKIPTSGGTRFIKITLTEEGAQAMNVFLYFLLKQLDVDGYERWRVPLRFAYTQFIPKGLWITDEAYATFAQEQIRYADYVISVDASGGAKILGVMFEPSEAYTDTQGAFARIHTAHWWGQGEEIDISVLELLAGIYGILMAIVHIGDAAPEGTIVHIKTDSSVALSGHQRGSHKRSKSASALLRRLYLIRSMLLEHTSLLFTYSYVNTLLNVFADGISRTKPPTAHVLRILRQCIRYEFPPLFSP